MIELREYFSLITKNGVSLSNELLFDNLIESRIRGSDSVENDSTSSNQDFEKQGIRFTFTATSSRVFLSVAATTSPNEP